MIAKILVILVLSSLTWAQVAGAKKKKVEDLPNVEIKAVYLKDNPNFLYMKSDQEIIKIKKSELTKEGVKQILANKEGVLTIFIPEKSVVSRTPRQDRETEE